MAFDLINLMKKRDFITWFLTKHNLKEEGLRSILEYIRDNRLILEKVKFVEDIRPYTTALLISSQDAETVSYLLRINGLYYENLEEFFAALKNEEYPLLYLWLSFDRSFLCASCNRVIRESNDLGNPIQTTPKRRSTKAIKSKEINRNSFKDKASEVLAQVEEVIKVRELRKDALKQKIDEALDNRDLNLFKALVKELKRSFNVIKFLFQGRIILSPLKEENANEMVCRSGTLY